MERWLVILAVAVLVMCIILVANWGYPAVGTAVSDQLERIGLGSGSSPDISSRQVDDNLRHMQQDQQRVNDNINMRRSLPY